MKTNKCTGIKKYFTGIATGAAIGVVLGAIYFKHVRHAGDVILDSTQRLGEWQVEQCPALDKYLIQPYEKMYDWMLPGVKNEEKQKRFRENLQKRLEDYRKK